MKSHWTKAQRAAYSAAIKRGDTLAYYCSDQFGRPANGGRGTVCSPLARHREENAVVCQTGLHATLDSPHRWRGCRVWVVALHGIAGREGEKICARERLVIGEILPEECIDPGVAIRLGVTADLRSADLYAANLYAANLSSADLSSADLRSANLYAADLSSADLYAAALRSADLRSANLRSADLYAANLSSANLSSADLSSADLRSANLYAADLRAADLYAANLRAADLSSANLCGARTWCEKINNWRTFTLEDAIKAGAINADKAVWS